MQFENVFSVVLFFLVMLFRRKNFQEECEIPSPLWSLCNLQHSAWGRLGRVIGYSGCMFYFCVLPCIDDKWPRVESVVLEFVQGMFFL